MKRMFAAAAAAAAICAAVDVKATTYYFAKTPEDANLDTIKNWRSGGAGGTTSPTAFSASDTYQVTGSSSLPAGATAWTISGDFNQLGILATTKDSSAAVEPKVCRVDLADHTLTLYSILSRGQLEFTGGAVVSTTKSSSSVSLLNVIGNNSTPGDCRATFTGAGTTFSAVPGSRIIIPGTSYNGASNNRLEVLDGAKILSGWVTVGYNDALADGVVQTNNAFIVSGAGSSATLNRFDMRGGSTNILTVADGAALTVTNTATCFMVGVRATATYPANGNIVTVTGQGTTLDVAGEFRHGSNTNSHDNCFIVSDGATARLAGNFYIGNDGDAIRGSSGNSVTVTGAGSSLAAAGPTVVGRGQNARDNLLAVSDGATATLASLQIGNAVDATGNALRVAGAGSQVAMSGSTYIGGNTTSGSKNARIEVLDGATFDTGSSLLWIGRYSTECELFVSNATAKVGGELLMGKYSSDVNDNNPAGVGTIRIAGENPSFEVEGSISTYSSSVAQKMVFDLPQAGWATAPVKFTKAITFGGTDSSLEITVNAKGVKPGRYVLVSSTADITYADKISLSAESSENVSLDTSNAKEIAVKVKAVGLAIIFR